MAVEIPEQKLARMFSKYLKLVCFYIVIFLMIWSRPAVSFSTITSLPGFSAPLPFTLETGYIGVGDVEFFYYFVESESNPAEDPLLLWLSGGPGCSSICGLLFEIGPLKFNMVEYNGSLPTFALNPYSWTKVASFIFLDTPVGTGFSYSRTSQGFKTGDKKQAIDGYNFLRKWLHSHPKFIKNPLYIGGDSYAGMIVPQIAQAIADDIEERSVPAMNLKGYVLGNPATDSKFDYNSKIPFVHRTALISDELYESAKRSCKGEYVEVDIDNVMCAKDLRAISECTAHISRRHILEPECPNDFQPPNSLDNNRKFFLETHEGTCLAHISQRHILEPECRNDFQPSNSLDNDRKIFLETQEGYRRVQDEFPKFGCPTYQSYLLTVWVNDLSVQKALHTRTGTIGEWLRCNSNLDYVRDVKSAVSYHGYLNRKGYRALIYSGDHDVSIPYLGTKAWIRSLSLLIVDSWRPWFVDDQVAGYSTEFQNNLTFATVKGGGHIAPEYQPKECFAMFERWVSEQPL